MKRKNEISPIDRDVAKYFQDPEFAASYYEELAQAPVHLQLSILRRLRGVTQEKPGSDHLLSNY